MDNTTLRYYFYFIKKLRLKSINWLRVSESLKSHIINYQVILSLSDFSFLMSREYIKTGICIEHIEVNGCDFKIASLCPAALGCAHSSQKEREQWLSTLMCHNTLTMKFIVTVILRGTKTRSVDVTLGTC